MKKQLFILTVTLSALSLQGCKDNLNQSIPASRTYQEDATVLNKFVEINKTTHECYINPNKRNSALSYITNADAEELNLVNPLNLKSFNQSLSQINGWSKQLAGSHNIDYIIMITENDTYVSRINTSSPIKIEQQNPNSNNYLTTATSLDVTGHKEHYYVDNDKHVSTSVKLKPHAYQNAGWAFLTTCHLNGNGNKKSVQVLFCGVGCNTTAFPCFEWSTVEGNRAEWNFETISLNKNMPHIAYLNFLRR